MVYKITVRAEQQIIDAYLYGYQTFGAEQAERYAQQLERCFDLLAANPHMAPTRDGYAEPLRVHHHAKHVVVYRVLEDSGDISILAVLREESDLARHLRTL